MTDELVVGSSPAEMIAPARPPENLAYVDALRGWAILGVLTYHVQSQRGTPAGYINSLLNEGWRGVQLFLSSLPSL